MTLRIQPNSPYTLQSLRHGSRRATSLYTREAFGLGPKGGVLTPPGPNFGWRRGGFYIRPLAFTVTRNCMVDCRGQRGRRGEQCSPVRFGGSAKLPGAAGTPPFTRGRAVAVWERNACTREPAAMVNCTRCATIRHTMKQKEEICKIIWSRRLGRGIARR